MTATPEAPSSASTPSSDAALAAVQGCGGAIRQLDGCLEQIDGLIDRLDDEGYARPLDGIFGGSIGGHVRHCLDHVRCLAGTGERLAAGEDATSSSCDPADYDTRDRGTTVESDRDVARSEIASLRSRLATAESVALDVAVDLSIMMSPDGLRIPARSTFGREIAFVFSHTIHHQAMIGGMARHLGVDPPEGFGRAPSTRKHDGETG